MHYQSLWFIYIYMSSCSCDSQRCKLIFFFCFFVEPSSQGIYIILGKNKWLNVSTQGWIQRHKGFTESPNSCSVLWPVDRSDLLMFSIICNLYVDKTSYINFQHLQNCLGTLYPLKVGASSQCYWDRLMLLKCELMLVKFELMLVKCQINTKWL